MFGNFSEPNAKLEYGLVVWLPICLWSHLPNALVLSSSPQHRRAQSGGVGVDLYHRSCISPLHNLNCFLLLSISQFTIVFQFGMAPLGSRFSELLRWSPKKIPGWSISPQSLSPSFSGGLSQGQEFRVVCLPRIEQKISDGQLWGAIVGSDVPRLDCGTDWRCGCLWASVVQKCLWSSHQRQPLLQNSGDYSDLFWWMLLQKVLKNIQDNISAENYSTVDISTVLRVIDRAV